MARPGERPALNGETYSTHTAAAATTTRRAAPLLPPLRDIALLLSYGEGRGTA